MGRMSRLATKMMSQEFMTSEATVGTDEDCEDFVKRKPSTLPAKF